MALCCNRLQTQGHSEYICVTVSLNYRDSYLIIGKIRSVWAFWCFTHLAVWCLREWCARSQCQPSVVKEKLEVVIRHWGVVFGEEGVKETRNRAAGWQGDLGETRVIDGPSQSLWSMRGGWMVVREPFLDALVNKEKVITVLPSDNLNNTCISLFVPCL